MQNKPVFSGLVFDENNNLVTDTYVGDDPCYVVNDNGFKRHIPSAQIDRQVFESMTQLIQGHEEALSEQAAKFLGQDDIFSKALLENQFKNIDKQLDQLLQIGIPEEARAYLGMMGFRITINMHGDVLEIQQPGRLDAEDNE